MNGNKQDIINRVTKIMVDKLNINSELMKREYYNEPLTGYIYNFRPRDLVYLFFEVEREFDLKINALDILNYEFNTISGVINIIEKQKVNSLKIHNTLQ